MNKKAIALLLGMTMITASLAGCGKGETKQSSEQKETQIQSSVETKDSSEAAEESNAEVPEEIPWDYFAGTELTIAVLKPGNSTSNSYNEKAQIKAVEEATGIHINWIEVEESVAGERVDVMLMDKDQPDAYMSLIGKNTLMANPEMFYNLTADGMELLETWAPHVLETYAEITADGADVLKMLTLLDGSVRSLAGNSASSPTSDGGATWLINQAWLDQLGLEVPTTGEEFYNVLCAFRDNDMNGNGIDDEIPMSFCNSDGYAKMWEIANAFGLGGGNMMYKPYCMIQDGTVVSTADTENFRSFIEFIHKLIEEGLCDKEGFSQTSEQFKSKIAENKVGFYTGWSPTTGEGLDFVAMRPFQALEDVAPVKSGTDKYYFGALSGFVPTADCNIEPLLLWWDFLHSSTQVKTLGYQGEEGVYWESTGDPENPVRTILGEGYTEEEVYANYYFNKVAFDSAPHRSYREFTDKEGWKFDAVNLVRDLMIDYKDDFQVGFVDATATEERSFIQADLIPYIDGFMADAMLEGLTDEAWEEHLEALKDYQYDAYIEWWQKYLDGEYFGG